jgi:hypothetical protein
LTAFCLFKEGKEGEKTPASEPKYMKLMRAVSNYSEFSAFSESSVSTVSPEAPSSFRCAQLFKVGVVVHRWVRRAREQMRKDVDARVQAALQEVAEAPEPDSLILANFMNRQKTYYDCVQGFTKHELASALRKSGNQAPVALLLLSLKRRSAKVALPPQYMLSEGGRVQQQVMIIQPPVSPADIAQKLGKSTMYAGKPFLDALAEPPLEKPRMYCQHFVGPEEMPIDSEGFA